MKRLKYIMNIYSNWPIVFKTKLRIICWSPSSKQVYNFTCISPWHWPNVATFSKKKEIVVFVKRTWAMLNIIRKFWNLPSNQRRTTKRIWYVATIINQIIPRSVAIGIQRILTFDWRTNQQHLLLKFQYHQRVPKFNPIEIQIRTKAIRIQTIKFIDILSIDRNIWHYPHKETTQTMFSKKQPPTKTKKEEVVVNMVLIVTTKAKVPKILAFKDKEPYKAKFAQDWKEEEKLQKNLRLQ